MTRVEKIKRIQELLANQAGTHLAYGKSWGADFCKSELEGLRDQIIEKLGRVSLDGLTKEEADSLDFGKWDEADALRLAPIWLYPFLCPGDALCSIGGETVVVGEDYTNRDADGYIDNDQRFGYLAYGVKAA